MPEIYRYVVAGAACYGAIARTFAHDNQGFQDIEFVRRTRRGMADQALSFGADTIAIRGAAVIPTIEFVSFPAAGWVTAYPALSIGIILTTTNSPLVRVRVLVVPRKLI